MKNIEISEKMLKQAKAIQDRNGKDNSDRIKSATQKMTELFRLN